MFHGLTTAGRTLTILPFPGKDAENFSDALPWFPVVGFILGLILYGLGLAFEAITPAWPMGQSLLILVASVILTRGLHLDGLADWFDGLGGGRTPDKFLAIMKDSHVGVFGVLALVLVLLAKWVAITHLMETGQLALILAPYIVSRTLLVELSVCFPYARPEGGTAGPFMAQARPFHRWMALCLATVFLFLAFKWSGILLLVGGWIFARLLGRWFMGRIRGITGDTLGTACELTEILLLLICAIVGFAFQI
jgi:adenosylcobinamide-GDP ribazoletransferase